MANPVAPQAVKPIDAFGKKRLNVEEADKALAVFFCAIKALGWSWWDVDHAFNLTDSPLSYYWRKGMSTPSQKYLIKLVEALLQQFSPESLQIDAGIEKEVKKSKKKTGLESLMVESQVSFDQKLAEAQSNNA